MFQKWSILLGLTFVSLAYSVTLWKKPIPPIGTIYISNNYLCFDSPMQGQPLLLYLPPPRFSHEQPKNHTGAPVIARTVPYGHQNYSNLG